MLLVVIVVLFGFAFFSFNLVLSERYAKIFVD